MDGAEHAGQAPRRHQDGKGGRQMNDLLLKILAIARSGLAGESGQSMSEYVMAVAVIAFGCIAGEAAIASSVNHTFVAVATSITSNIFH